MIRKTKSLMVFLFSGRRGPMSGRARTARKNRTARTGSRLENALSVQDILERNAAVGDYTNQVSCLSARRMRGTDVLDSRHVTFKMGRDEYYLVQFKHRCLAAQQSTSALGYA